MNIQVWKLRVWVNALKLYHYINPIADKTKQKPATAAAAAVVAVVVVVIVVVVVAVVLSSSSKLV